MVGWSTGYSHRRHGFDSQHQHNSSQLPITPVPCDVMPLLALYVIHKHRCWQDIHIHKIIKNTFPLLEIKSLENIYFTFSHVHICVHEYMSTDALGCQRKGVRSLETRIRSNCYLPDVGAGNQTWVLCRSSTSFQWQTQLQSLRHGFLTHFLFLPQQPAPCNKK